MRRLCKRCDCRAIVTAYMYMRTLSMLFLCFCFRGCFRLCLWRPLQGITSRSPFKNFSQHPRVTCTRTNHLTQCSCIVVMFILEARSEGWGRKIIEAGRTLTRIIFMTSSMTFQTTPIPMVFLFERLFFGHWLSAQQLTGTQYCLQLQPVSPKHRWPARTLD